MSSDTQIARQWAEGFIKHAESAQIVDADALTAARHILATTTPPTMADVEWDAEVHAGLVARHYDGDLVRMIGPDWDDGECIICIDSEGIAVTLHGGNLTPLPGTRLDLAPRREPEPESAPDHPVFLETEEDYESAPVGTISAGNGQWPYLLTKSGWLGPTGNYVNHSEMAGIRRRVLRRGWEA